MLATAVTVVSAWCWWASVGNFSVAENSLIYKLLFRSMKRQRFFMVWRYDINHSPTAFYNIKNVIQISKSIYFAQQINLFSSANQFVFLSKSICFPRQINLFCSTTWRLQPCWMTFSMMLNDVDDYAISMSLVSKFIEFPQQIHWNWSANSLSLLNYMALMSI